ncbi:MAG: hypothetical protein ACREE8_03005, partial [Hypericibacter sp.]
MAQSGSTSDRASRSAAIAASSDAMRLRSRSRCASAGMATFWQPHRAAGSDSRAMPNFKLERETAITPVAGIDEAGRGPLAGPVFAAAVILDMERTPRK